MAVSIDTSVGSLTFNCYCSLTDANSYHDGRLHNTAWTGASNPDKIKSLLWATKLLDTLKWRGVRSSGTQTHEFPRRGLTYAENSTYAGYDYEIVDIVS